MIDQHVHINDDDAKNPVEKVLEHAADQDIEAIGIVVHDYVGHMERCQALGERYGVRVYAVSELSGVDGHYLQFFPDVSAAYDKGFVARLQRVYDARRKKLELLSAHTLAHPFRLDVRGQEVEFSFTLDDLERVASGGRVLPGHLSQLLSEQVGGAVAGRAAFRLLQPLFQADCYVDHPDYRLALLTLDELVIYKKRFGTALVQAHPPKLSKNARDEKLRQGVDGFELSPKNTVQYNRSLVEYSRKTGSIITIGSDNHMWEVDTLGFLAWQPELEGVVDEGAVVRRLDDILSGRAAARRG